MSGIVRVMFLSLQEALEGDSIMDGMDRGSKWKRFKEIVGCFFGENISEGHPVERISDPGCDLTGMDLATALAAERRDAPPRKASLMSLMVETEGGDEKGKEGGGIGMDWACCVCMVRKKGAAFIPCGHTFCRLCSREVCLNRGSCPLCNRQILEILDIF